MRHEIIAHGGCSLCLRRQQQSADITFLGRPSVRCPLTHISRDTISLYLVEEL